MCDSDNKAQLDRIEKDLADLKAFAAQLVAAVEQFQSGGMGKIIASMMGGGRK